VAPNRISTVPITPTDFPAARRIASTRYVVVVLPFVPVTPISVMPFAGSPNERATSRPSTFAVDGTTTIAGGFVLRLSRAVLASTSRSTITAAAPRSTADSTNE